MNYNNLKTVSFGNAVELAVLSTASGNVATIKFDLKDSRMNLLSFSVMNELSAALSAVEQEPNLKGLVIYSGKEDSFFAGANLAEIQQAQYSPPTVSYEAVENGKAVFDKIAKLKIRTVVAIHGVCMGGGTELALACNYRILSDDSKTRMGLPEVGLGFIPGWGGTVRLPKLVGIQDALELICQPLKAWNADKAWRKGLASEIVPASKLFDRAMAVALGANPKSYNKSLKDKLMNLAIERRYPAALVLAFSGLFAGAIVGFVLAGFVGLLFGVGLPWAYVGTTYGMWLGAIIGLVTGFAAPHGKNFVRKQATAAIMKETRGNYPAPLAALKVAMAALDMPETKAFKLESRVFADLCVGDVSRNLVRLFISSQEAKKVPSGLKPAVEVKTLGVLGCGVMGSGIAFSAAAAGYKVVVREPFAKSMERGKLAIKTQLDELAKKRKLSQAWADEIFASMVFTENYADMSDCDLVIEAIIEDVPAKQAALAELEKVINKPFIFATNTSSLSVTELASTATNGDLYGGLHFFNPVPKMPLVEIVRGPKTSDATVAALKLFSAKLGKTVVTTKDSPGFVVNRILAPYLLEAIKLFESGVPGEDIEKAMTKFGMPMGPLALLDEVGLDIAAKVIEQMHGAFGARLAAPKLMDYINKNKLLGKKGGKGLYLYDAKGKRQGFNPDILAQVSKVKKPKKIEEIQERLALAMVNEAALCMSEGIVETDEELDIAMIMGTGFAPFRGGVLRYADSIGSRSLLQRLESLYQVAGDNYKPAQLVRDMARAGKNFCQH